MAVVYVLLLALALAVAEQDEMITALADDDQCDGRVDGNCSLTMLQMRGVQAGVAAAERWASCRSYGCGGHYRRHRHCQCNKGCKEYDNCCDDFEEVCEVEATCKNYGCGAQYNYRRYCQCNDDCDSHGNCCLDYQATCLGSEPNSTSGHDDTGKVPHTQTRVFGHPSPHKKYPTYDGFTLALVEEFDEPIDLDTDPIWTWSDGGLIEGQIRFVKEAVTFKDGKMRIEVSKNRHVHTENCSNAEVDEIPPKEMTSGEMRTKHNMFRYGRYEASMRAPKVQPGNSIINGNYVSTMFVFRDAKYKHWREIDMEITGDHPDSVTTNILSADNTTRWNANIAESKGFRMGTNLRSQFHTFAFEWLPDRVSWYFNGKLIREKKGGHVPIPDISAKIMMNLWMFDDRALFGGPEIWNNHYPMSSEYDWFRFYKWDGDDTYPCQDFSTSCLTSDDMYLSSNNPCDGIPQVGTVYGKAPCHATCRHR